MYINRDVKLDILSVDIDNTGSIYWPTNALPSDCLQSFFAHRRVAGFELCQQNPTDSLMDL